MKLGKPLTFDKLIFPISNSAAVCGSLWGLYLSTGDLLNLVWHGVALQTD
jgi:hypothetical protein